MIASGATPRHAATPKHKLCLCTVARPCPGTALSAIRSGKQRGWAGTIRTSAAGSAPPRHRHGGAANGVRGDRLLGMKSPGTRRPPPRPPPSMRSSRDAGGASPPSDEGRPRGRLRPSAGRGPSKVTRGHRIPPRRAAGRETWAAGGSKFALHGGPSRRRLLWAAATPRRCGPSRVPCNKARCWLEPT